MPLLRLSKDLVEFAPAGTNKMKIDFWREPPALDKNTSRRQT